MGTSAVPFFCTELSFLNKKGMWGCAVIFALSGSSSPSEGGGWEGQCLWKSASGHPQVAFKNSAVAFGSKKCIISVTEHDSVTVGKSAAGGGTQRTESNQLLLPMVLKIHLFLL